VPNDVGATPAWRHARGSDPLALSQRRGGIDRTLLVVVLARDGPVRHAAAAPATFLSVGVGTIVPMTTDHDTPTEPDPARPDPTPVPTPWRDARGWFLSDPTYLDHLELRYVLTDLVAGTPGRVWTVAELARTVEGAGFRIPGRSSKTVSDLLRTEVARGRLHRVGRGRYVVGSIPGATRRRIRRTARYRSDLLASAPRQAGSWPGADHPGSLDP